MWERASHLLGAVLAVALSSFILATPLAAASPGDELIGLWGYGTAFGPMLEGELAITRAGNQWRATMTARRCTTCARRGRPSPR